MSFIEKGNEYGVDQLLSGTGHKVMELEVPQGKSVKRGQAVNASAELSDGTDLFGIVLETADGTTAKTKTTVVVFGEVIFEGLELKAATVKSDFIKKAKGRVKISLAHTNADFQTALLAYRAGASHAVHLFNAMTGLDHRNPGVVGATVESKEVYAELITDGIHVHPVMVRAAFALLGEDRVVLISDSLRSTGMPDGIYDLGGQKVQKEGKRCTLVEGGNLAGSVSNVFDCMKTAVQLMKIPFRSAILASTINPAKALGVEKTVGSISVGKKADYLLLDNELNLKAVYQSGKEIE